MKKKVILKRISAFLCALVVFVGMFAGATPFYAASSASIVNSILLERAGYTLDLDDSFRYMLLYNKSTDDYYTFGGKDGVHLVAYVCDSSVSGYSHGIGLCEYDWVRIEDADSVNKYGLFTYVSYLNSSVSFFSQTVRGSSSYSLNYSLDDIEVLYSDFTIYKPVRMYKGYAYREEADEIFYSANSGGEVTPEGAALGYLQNLQYYIAYERGALYNYNEDSRTDFWSFDQFTTTDLDLTAGNYTVRHYIRPVLCKSYEDDGVIEEYDKYLMGEYDAAALEFSYLRKDYDKKLEEYGYDGIGFIDAYLLGRFVLEWHYFELVDNDTGAVGGYVLMKPKDATGENFGVEYVGTTYDQDGNVDEDGYTDDVVIHGVGGGTTIDEALENAKDDSQRVDPLAGLDGFIANLQAFSVSLENVPLAIKSVIELFPGWVLALFGLSFALTFLAILVKVLRG